MDTNTPSIIAKADYLFPKGSRVQRLGEDPIGEVIAVGADGTYTIQFTRALPGVSITTLAYYPAALLQAAPVPDMPQAAQPADQARAAILKKSPVIFKAPDGGKIP